MEDNNLYKVKDLYLAAFIYSQQKELVTIDRENSICWFAFSDKDACNTLAKLYWTNQAVGQIKSYAEAIRSLKDLIFAQR